VKIDPDRGAATITRWSGSTVSSTGSTAALTRAGAARSCGGSMVG
jgi:hypothetical protein